MALLHTIAEVLPIGPDEWEIVSAKHCDDFPSTRRDKESIRRKFTKLSSTKIPTGDPNCPEDVRFAKNVSRQIEDKMESVEEIDEDDLGFPKEDGDAVAQLPPEPQATPIRRGRPPKPPPAQSTDQLLNMMMFKMVQDQDRQEERREERRRQQINEARRQDMMQMMMMGMLTRVVGGGSGGGDNNISSMLHQFEQDEHKDEGDDDDDK